MDENPYKAPQEPGRPPRPSRFWKQFLDLVLLIVVACLCLLGLMVILAAACGPRVN